MGTFLARVRMYWNNHPFCVAVELARREVHVDPAFTYQDIAGLLNKRTCRSSFPEPARIVEMMARQGVK